MESSLVRTKPVKAMTVAELEEVKSRASHEMLYSTLAYLRYNEVCYELSLRRDRAARAYHNDPS